jgi:hypothetical protein
MAPSSVERRRAAHSVEPLRRSLGATGTLTPVPQPGESNADAQHRAERGELLADPRRADRRDGMPADAVTGADAQAVAAFVAAVTAH